MKEHLKNFTLLTVSTLIMAVGIYFFKFANNFTFGGITGFAVLVAKFTPLSASDFSFIANMLLLIIGLFVLGKKFAAQTAYSSILLSVTLSGLERIYPMSHPYQRTIAGTDLRDCTSCHRFGHSVQYRSIQRGHGCYCHDIEEIHQR